MTGTREQARVVVEDNGIGIPPEHLPHVFERFYRADASRSRRTEGLGLGLAICRSITEGHNGQIEVQSQLGRGTRVTLTLPRVDQTGCEPPIDDEIARAAASGIAEGAQEPAGTR